MQFSMLPLLSAAILLAGTTSAAYVNIDPSPHCSGTPVVNFNLQANHSQCFQRGSGQASLFISLDTFPCTVQLFTSTDESCGGSVVNTLYVSKNAHGCIDFTKASQDIFAKCGSA